MLWCQRRLATAFVEFAYENPRLWELIQQHHPADRAGGPDWFIDSLYAPLGRIEDVLGKLQSDCDAEDTARTARLMWASVHGILNVATTAKYGPLPLATTVSMAETMIVHILAGATRSSRREPPRRLAAENRDRAAG